MRGAEGSRTDNEVSARAGLTELFHLHYRRLAGLAALLVEDRAPAEDVVLAAFEGLYRRWRGLGDPQARVAYLNRSVVDASRSRHHPRAVEQSRSPGDGDLLPAVWPTVAESVEQALIGAWRLLPAVEREAVVLKSFLDLSEDQIAGWLGVSSNNMREHALRASIALQDSVRDLDVDDLEATLASVLQREADRCTARLDGVADTRRLAFRLDRIDRDGRRRTWRTVVAVAAATLVMIVAVVVGRAHHPAPDRPLDHVSAAVPGGLLITSHPYLPGWLTSDWRVVRRPEARMPRLTHCVPDPRRWGASFVQGTTYVGPGSTPHDGRPGTRVNEWLLQYPDASAAHRVMVTMNQHLRACPTPTDARDDPVDTDRNRDSSSDYDEAFGSQRLWYASAAHRGRPVGIYVLRVARVRNVVVVLEDTGIGSDRTPFALTTAVGAAVPHFRMFNWFGPDAAEGAT